MCSTATRPVVVGVDGTDAAIEAARWAGEIARPEPGFGLR